MVHGPHQGGVAGGGGGGARRTALKSWKLLAVENRAKHSTARGYRWKGRRRAVVDLLCVGSTCSSAGCHVDQLLGGAAFVLNGDECCGQLARVVSWNTWATLDDTEQC